MTTSFSAEPESFLELLVALRDVSKQIEEALSGFRDRRLAAYELRERLITCLATTRLLKAERAPAPDEPRRFLTDSLDGLAAVLSGAIVRLPAQLQHPWDDD